MKDVGTKGFTQPGKNHLNYTFSSDGTIGSSEGNGFIGLEDLSGSVNSLGIFTYDVLVSTSTSPCLQYLASQLREHKGTCSPVTVLHFVQHKSRPIPVKTLSHFLRKDFKSSLSSEILRRSSVPYSAPASSLVLNWTSNMSKT